ncbi:hypothetical protein HX004_10910 [Myroides sp. 1354]|uniref:hypothetical protein n=1 Tax=unclassified Myroides TaxID=2642485 RepID=UPI0025754458|nr:MULTISPECIES: hypothetical protein [unclassified Myroides]MDM1044405.1 hypothetical protein [Myroides sp. R163-1]MDM1056280.1 hypothetical protein [Myroides sp. 1354]MDM1069364.1 hypothetical protein [Myroides sp. 1372]
MKDKIGRIFLGMGIGLLLLLCTGTMKRDIAKTDFFVGKYCGVVLFEQDDVTIQCHKSCIRVVKIGNKVSFYFRHNIPTLAEIELVQEDGGPMINRDAIETNFIRLNHAKLEVLFTIGAKSYTVYARSE